jgi:hypothetical protein
VSAMADYAIWLDEHGLADSEDNRAAYLASGVTARMRRDDEQIAGWFADAAAESAADYARDHTPH